VPKSFKLFAHSDLRCLHIGTEESYYVAAAKNTLQPMLRLLICLLWITAQASAQTDLKFDKRFVDSEDRWVAFQQGKDGAHVFGFIYIDKDAGLTLNYEGSFTIDETGRYMAKRLDTTNIKVRLKPNDVRVAFIPESRYEELGIDAVPEWLNIYKGDTSSVARLYRWGYLYNSWGECAKALTYLERAYKQYAQFASLAPEIAFSYNCLKQYDKAIPVLQDALQRDPKNAYINKELVYALIKLGRLAEAAESCKQAITNSSDQKYNGENCYNLLYSFYAIDDKDNFHLWLPEAKKWNAKNKDLLDNISIMAKEIKK
jgi:tetratricopeptide (TPR) repeat protein